MIERNQCNLIIVTGFIIQLVIGVIYLNYNKGEPLYYDARDYFQLAIMISENGLFSFSNETRTFAYPFILSLFRPEGEYSNSIYWVFLLQFFLYATATYLVYCSMKSVSKISALIVFILLSLNVYIAPYLSLPLTDSIYTSLCLFIFAAYIISSTIHRSDCSDIKLIVTITFLTATIVVIRPASIWLIAPSIYTLFTIVRKSKLKKIYVFLAFSLSLLPLFVQCHINYLSFGEYTFLPVRDLGSEQIVWGIEYIKYGTWLGEGGPRNIYTSSSLVNLSGMSKGIYWYLTNPIDAVRLLYVKLVGAFDFDFIHPYAKGKPLPLLLSIIPMSIFCLGVISITYHACVQRVTLFGPRYFPIIIFMSWGAVSLASATELRFTLPLLAYFSILGILFVREIYSGKECRKTQALMVLLFIFVCINIYIANYVREQSEILVNLKIW